jgi:hypothetical protein
MEGGFLQPAKESLNLKVRRYQGALSSPLAFFPLHPCAIARPRSNLVALVGILVRFSG